MKENANGSGGDSIVASMEEAKLQLVKSSWCWERCEGPLREDGSEGCESGMGGQGGFEGRLSWCRREREIGEREIWMRASGVKSGYKNIYQEGKQNGLIV